MTENRPDIGAGLAARRAWSVLGMPVDDVSMDDAEALVRSAVKTREKLSFVTPNLNWLVRSLRDPMAMQHVREADLSVADGAPIVWLARRLGAPLTERVAGSDLFERLREKRSGEPPIRVFFFGGRDGAAQAAMDALNADEDAGMIGCGALNPGYGTVTSMGASVFFDTINAARPDFVVVALGAAKGQAWISAYRNRIAAPVIAHLGAVVDFVAGTIPRAPQWMSRAGLEWLWRIGAEPALLSRYLSDGWALLRLVPGRVMPLQRDLRNRQSSGDGQINVQTTDGPLQVTLSGDLTNDHLAELRTALARGVDEARDIDLHVAGIGRIDTAFFGLLCLAQSRVLAAGNAFRVFGADAVLSENLRAEIGTDSFTIIEPKSENKNNDVSRSIAS